MQTIGCASHDQIIDRCGAYAHSLIYQTRIATILEECAPVGSVVIVGISLIIFPFILKSFVYHDEITLCQYVTYLTLPQKVALGHADSPIKQSSQHAIHALTVILLLFTCWQAAA